jgi:hypothetical protein
MNLLTFLRKFVQHHSQQQMSTDTQHAVESPDDYCSTSEQWGLMHEANKNSHQQHCVEKNGSYNQGMHNKQKCTVSVFELCVQSNIVSY